MRHRVNSLVSMVFVSLLAAAMVPGATRVASAAEGCIEKPGREVKQGHWYFRSDRLHHRRCWFFESSATATPSASTDRTPAANAKPESWLNLFAAGATQNANSEPKQSGTLSPSAQTSQDNISAFSPEPPQTGIPNSSGAVMKTAPPKRLLTRKIVRQDQPQLAPPPTTTGLAGTERPDQLPTQTAAEKDDKQAQQLTDAERQALFEEFLKWYRSRAIFGQP